jgi:hypothetical protein
MSERAITQVSARRRRTMKRLSAIFVTAAALTALIVSPVDADAQGHARGRTFTKVDVGRVIARVEDQSGAFRKAVDRQLDHSRLNGSKREDRINAEVKQYDRTVDELRSEFGRHDSWMDTRGNVERVLHEAADVNRIIRGENLGRGVENEWGNLRRELNMLADVYNLTPLR